MVFHLFRSATGSGLKWLDAKSEASSSIRRNVEVVETADWVIFDFSAWDARELNFESTSYLIGLADGVMQLTSSSRGRAETIYCESSSMLPATGRDIIWIYRWCRQNAPSAARRQRVFRFEKGKYVGEGTHLRLSMDNHRRELS